MRKAFPQKMLAELGLDASSATSTSAKKSVRRRRTTVATAVTPVRAQAQSALDTLSRTLQPDLDDLDLAW